VLLVRGGEVLLVRRGAEPALGRWDIPGGFLEEGEAPEDGARREIREELGLDLAPDRLRLVMAYIHRRRDFAVLDILFEAPMPDQQPRPGSDAAACGWFPIDDLPDDIAFEATRNALERWRAARSSG
jgi:8-oxo-dGTP diphosphatase